MTLYTWQQSSSKLGLVYLKLALKKVVNVPGSDPCTFGRMCRPVVIMAHQVTAPCAYSPRNIARFIIWIRDLTYWYYTDISTQSPMAFPEGFTCGTGI